MRAKNKTKVGPRKKGGKRVLKLALVIIGILIVSVIFLTPAIVSSAKARQIILAKINNSVSGKTNFDELSMGWLKGIRVSDFSFNDNSGQISVQVKEIATKPEYGSLLTGNLSFGQTLIDKPNVQINLKESKAQKPVESGPKPSAGRIKQPIVLPIKRMDLIVKDGDVKVTDPKSGTVQLSRINSKLDLQPPGQQTNLDLTMTVAQAGKTSEIQVAGSVTPKKQTGWSLKGTSGDLTIDVNGLDLESLGPIFAIAGVNVEAKGILNGQVKSKIKDGNFENLTANLNGRNLDITAEQLKGDRIQTGTLEADVKLNQNAETINIDNLHLKSDWAAVTASGSVPKTLKSLNDFLAPGSNYTLKGTFNCNVAALSSQMPKTLGLKEGMKLTSGQLNGNVETSTKAGGQKQIQANATISALEGTVEGKKIALSQPIEAQAQISSDKTGINFDKVDVSSSFVKINCTGSAESLKYTAQGDLAKLQAELGQFVDFGQYKMSGEVQETGQMSIEENKIAASGSGTIKNLRLVSNEGQSASEPLANVKYNINMDRKNNLVNVESVTADASLGQFSIKDGVVPLNKDSAQPLSVDVSINNFDLAKIKPFAIMFSSLPKETQLAGIADSTVSLTSKKNIYTIKTDSTKIKDLKLTSPGKKPFEEKEVTLSFEAEVDPEKAINIKTFKLESPQIKITKGQVSQVSKDGKTTLQGQADLEYDWSAVNTVAAPYLPEDLTLQGKRKDTISFSSEYPTGQTDKLMPNLNAKADVGFEKAGYMGLDFGPTTVDIQVQNGLLNIAPLTTTVNDGQFNFAGSANFKQSPPLFKVAKPMQIIKNIKINDATTKKLLKYVNPIFADAVNVSGIANFNCEQLTIPFNAKAKNDAVVIGTISISDLRLQASDLLGQIISIAGGNTTGTVLTVHPTRLVLQKGVLRYDNMQIDVDNNPVNFKGAIGLDKSLDMTVTLPYTTAGRTARVGRETSGARIALPLKGTVDKPKLDMSKFLELQLKGQLEEQLQRGLENILK
jgi:hypothetical protein